MSESAYFLSPEGQVVEVDAAQAPLLGSARGYTPATPQQITDFQATAKYGSPGQQAIAGLEGLGRGLTARLSTAAEVGLGVPAEDIQGRMKANPGTALVTEAGGLGASLIAGAGAPSLIGKAGVAVGGGIAGGAVEGALYGAGNVVHEAALGDPNLTAQSALAQVGVSAALGGAISGVLGVAQSGLKAAIGKAQDAGIKLADGIATPEKLKELAQEHYSSVNSALRIANKEIRPAEVAATLTTAPDVAQAEVQRLAGRLTEVATNMRTEMPWVSSMFPTKLEQIAQSIGKETEPAAAFEALNTAKQTIDKQLGKWGRFIAPEQQDAIGAIRGIRTELKTALENPQVWGETGARQAAFNDAQSSFLEAQKDFQKEFMLKRPGKGTAPVFTIDPGKLHRLSDTANPRFPMRQEIWDRYQAESKNLIEEIGNSHANAPVGNYDADALTNLVNKSGEMEQNVRQQGSILRMLGRVGGVGPMGTIAGSMAGMPALGVAFDVVAKGAKFIPRAVDALSHLQKNNEAVTAAISSAAARLGSASGKAATAGRGEVIAGLARTFGMDAEEAVTNFDKHSAEIRRYASDPNHFQAALEEQAQGLHEHAPQTAQALATTSARAVSFLASKLPQTVKLGPLSDPLPPSQHEIAVYNRYREAVEHPLSILSQAKAGTLTPEGVEALQAVYPHLFAQIQNSVLENLSPKAPYATRLMAAMILQRDLDGTTSGDAILRAQAMFVRPPMPMPTKRGGGGKPMNMHERTLTSSQRAAGGER